MATRNITLAIDENVLAKARDVAARRGTTLNAMIRTLLVGELDQEDRIAWAKKGLAKLMERSRLQFEPGTNLKEISRRYDADELHGHQRPAVGRRRHTG
jgi:hypothetical protein